MSAKSKWNLLIKTATIVFLFNSNSHARSCRLMNQIEEPLPQDTISSKKMEEWHNRWKRRGREYMNTNSIDYFTMPIANLTSLASENPTTARFYIGLDSISTSNFLPKLILVGTDGNGNPKFTNGGHIYDFTTVCPPACGDR